jgi:hypothetical protein
MEKPDPGSGLEIETFRPGKHTFHIYDRRCITVSQQLIEINCLSKHRVLILRRH